TPTAASAPQPVPQPTKPIKASPAPRPDAVRLSAGAKPESGQWVKGRIAAIEQNRLAVDVGLADTATLMYEHIPGKPDQIDAEDRYEIGQEIEARVRRINQRGRVQLTLLEG
ncbi:MAG: S1 RNA-binding domain-containing protein, partial [Anaerolineae bacterium]